MQIIILALRNLGRSLRRTILTTMTFAIATGILTVLIAVPASIDRMMEVSSNSLRVVVKGTYGVPARYCEKIRKIPGVVACGAMKMFVGGFRDMHNMVGAMGVDMEMAQVFPDYQITAAGMESMQRERRGAFVGAKLMKKNNWQIGQWVTLTDPAGRMSLEFAVLEQIRTENFASSFIFRRDLLVTAMEQMGFPSDRSDLIVARVDSSEKLGMVIAAIDETFRNSETETKTMTESDLLSVTLAAIGNVRAAVYGLCAAVIVTVLLIAGNSMAMMVRERLSDVAVMRAMGFGRGSVARMLVGEAAIIGIVGGIIGASISFVLFRKVLPEYLTTLILVNSPILIESLILTFALSLASCVIPVVRAIRVPPAMAFRSIV